MGDSDSDETSAQPRVRALLDTNVILDILLKREPWLTEAQSLIDAQAQGLLAAYMPASGLTDVFYISRRVVGIDRAFEVIDRCLEAFNIIPVDRRVLEMARASSGNDFEDNVQIACAQDAGLDLVITRDTAGFRDSPIPAIQPSAITEHLP